jgi:hypothetical protein
MPASPHTHSCATDEDIIARAPVYAQRCKGMESFHQKRWIAARTPLMLAVDMKK